MTLLLYLIIAATSIKTIMTPVTGVFAYYFLAIFGPQYIWFWIFEDLRVSLIVALSTICSFLFGILSGTVNTSIFRSKINFALLVLWLAISISYFWGPIVSEVQWQSDLFFDRANKMFIFYFISISLFKDVKTIKYFTLIIIVATIYLTYWANYQYVIGNWSVFELGRLRGPTPPNQKSLSFRAREVR